MSLLDVVVVVVVVPGLLPYIEWKLFHGTDPENTFTFNNRALFDVIAQDLI